MICVASLIVFSFLGIFSARYRELAFEAYNCMLDRITRGECDASFEDKIKAGLVGRVLDYSPKIAKLLNKHFEKLSLIFVILFVLSAVYTIKAIIFLLLYGSCAGPDTGCTVSKGLGSII